MTSLDKSSYTQMSTGKQLESQRKSAATYSISAVSRDARANVFITEEHIRASRLGRESPKDDNITLPSSIKVDRIRTTNFGYGGRTDFTAQKVDPDAIPSNDALDVLPCNNQFKYRRDATLVIGTEPRGKLKDATLMKSHSAAFFGRASPGPAAVGGDYGPDFKVTKPRMAMARPFASKTKLVWPGQGDNPPGVGPGTFERRDAAIGPQHLSSRRNQPVSSFSRAPKFPKDKPDEGIAAYDAARSSFGKQTLERNKSEPSVGFNHDSRDTRSRTKLCMTRLDEGPKANYPKMHCPMPQLPAEHRVMASGFG